MNLENTQKVIAFLRTRTWKTSWYMDTADCMRGVIGDALYGNRKHSQIHFVWGADYIAEHLGISHDAGVNLHIMTEGTAGEPSISRDVKAFCRLPVERQNEIFIGMLERLIASDGKVVDWGPAFE